MLRRQRGALIFITPLILTIIALFSVMALDGARIYGVRSNLQNQANAAASAGAEASQACGGVDVSVDTMKARALAAAQAQGFTGTAEDLDLRVGVMVPDPANPDQLLFQQVNDIAASNSVRVALSQTEPVSRLLPQAILGTVTLSASSAVRKEVRATLSAAGSTLGVSGGLLGGLLGAVFENPGYSLDPTSLESLEGTLFELGELLAFLGVDTLEEALPLGADELAAALREIVGNATPAGALLDDLVGATGISTLQIADVLTAVGDVEVSGTNKIELLNLVNSLLLNVIRQQQLLNGTPLSLVNLGAAGLPLLSSIDENSLVVNLYVNRPPKVVVDVPARKNLNGEWEGAFYAPDIGIEVIVNAEILPINLVIAELEVASLTIPLAVDLGGGDGYLSSALCARGVSNDVKFGLQLNRQVLELATGSIDLNTGDIVPQPIDAEVGKVSVLLGLISLDPILNVEAEITGEMAGTSGEVILEPDYPLYCSPTGCSKVTYNDAGGGLSALNTDVNLIDLSLLQGSLGGVDLTPIVAPVTPLISGLLSDVTASLTGAVVSPLLQFLGVGVGGISVTVSEGKQNYTQMIENVGLANGGQAL
ncbi:hypothetical protein [Marinobacter mobilis]|uniref:Uncharacterized membrane protein n=1 Tax=Marinobacter mobilis TaxID=488533 RepID=A0A1H2Y2C2_9GAMM|nr:hypothetical protein [Marinobacter mobilis]SDW99191.1 Uncharacterized membrane protein [Marinobacter mobilis]